jgi:hypothetical protein
MAEKPNNATDFARLAAVMEELRKEYDPRRSAAEQAEYAALAAKYPGQFVAFLDRWDGETLVRQVIAASPSVAELHRQLGDYPEYELFRKDIQATLVPDPSDETILVPALFEIEEENADGTADLQSPHQE